MGMKDAHYPVTLSPDLLRLMLEVSELLGRLDGLQLVRPVPKLREKNRTGSVRGSTGIEGNRCTLAQVEAIARGEPVAASKKDVLEVRNALAAYGELRDYDPYAIDALLRAHARLMGGGLMLGAGHFRREAVEVYVSEDKTREMPPWKSVEPSMRALFGYLKSGDDPLLLKSVRFHFECVNIHPFTDGNGRTARLWQTRLLMELHPIFEYLDVESMVFDARDTYYAVIREAQDTGDARCFVCFMLDQILRALTRLWQTCGPVASRWDSRIEGVRERFGDAPFSRKDYLQLQRTITPVTASRDLKAGVEEGLLVRAGDKRTAVYRFSRNEAAVERK